MVRAAVGAARQGATAGGDDGLAAQTRPALLHFLELQVPMALGALVCFFLGRVVTASPLEAADYQPGTVLYFLGDVFFLTGPVVGWMLLRDRGWRCSLELAVAMLIPVSAIVVVGQLRGSAYLLWLVTAMYPAMSLGMLAYLLYRKDVPGGRRLGRSEG